MLWTRMQCTALGQLASPSPIKMLCAYHLSELFFPSVHADMVVLQITQRFIQPLSDYGIEELFDKSKDRLAELKRLNRETLSEFIAVCFVRLNIYYQAYVRTFFISSLQTALETWIRIALQCYLKGDLLQPCARILVVPINIVSLKKLYTLTKCLILCAPADGAYVSVNPGGDQ